MKISSLLITLAKAADEYHCNYRQSKEDVHLSLYYNLQDCYTLHRQNILPV